MDSIHGSTLLPQEKARFERLRVDGLTPVRLFRLFETWEAYAMTITETRMASEQHFSVLELRADRLERIIREEQIINGRPPVLILKDQEEEYDDSAGLEIELEDNNGTADTRAVDDDNENESRDVDELRNS